ncbi:MAG: ZapG family protein [Succinivibrio sp.]
MQYMIIALVFLAGFFAGGICCYFGQGKLFPSRRVQDELTRTRRELASARRILDEFFRTSGALFGQLDKSYRAYASFMNEAAGKLSSQDGRLFIPEDEIEVEDSLKKMLSTSGMEDFSAESESVSAQREREQAILREAGDFDDPRTGQRQKEEPPSQADAPKDDKNTPEVKSAKETISVEPDDNGNGKTNG